MATTYTGDGETLMTNDMLTGLESIVERELTRLGWACDAANPCQAVAHAREHLPRGWVEVSDDSGSWGCGAAVDLASDLAAIEPGALTEAGGRLSDSREAALAELAEVAEIDEE